MFDEKHKGHISSALDAIKSVSQVNDGRVSYVMTKKYSLARLTITSLVRCTGVPRSQLERCIGNALRDYVLQDGKTPEEFSRLVVEEVGRWKRTGQRPYEVLRSAYASLKGELRSRRISGAYIRVCRTSKANGYYSADGMLSGSVARALYERNKLRQMTEDRQYLPQYREGNLCLAARVRSSGIQHANDVGAVAMDHYLALLNTGAGFQLGASWDMNPTQPQGAFIPAPYTTVHSEKGVLRDEVVNYEPNLSLVRPVGKHLPNETAESIDKKIDFVLSRIRKHFQPDKIWDAITLLGASYVETDDNHRFMKCWMALEQLMFAGAGESHDGMLKRMRVFYSGSMSDIEAGLLEGLRVTRNQVAHGGIEVGVTTGPFEETHFSALRSIVNRLLLFHLELPKVIRSRDDFVQFTKLSPDLGALDTRLGLVDTMRSMRRELNSK